MDPVELTLAPAPDDVRTMRDGMREYELSVLPDLPSEADDVTLYAFVRGAAGDVVGGVQATTSASATRSPGCWRTGRSGRCCST